jgi:hypothetical protein
MSTDDGNDVAGLKIERISDVTGGDDQELTAIAVIKTESEVSCVSVVGFMHNFCRLYPELPALITVCPCET